MRRRHNLKIGNNVSANGYIKIHGDTIWPVKIPREMLKGRNVCGKTSLCISHTIWCVDAPVSVVFLSGHSLEVLVLGAAFQKILQLFQEFLSWFIRFSCRVSWKGNFCSDFSSEQESVLNDRLASDISHWLLESSDESLSSSTTYTFAIDYRNNQVRNVHLHLFPKSQCWKDRYRSLFHAPKKWIMHILQHRYNSALGILRMIHLWNQLAKWSTRYALWIHVHSTYTLCVAPFSILIPTRHTCSNAHQLFIFFKPSLWVLEGMVNVRDCRVPKLHHSFRCILKIHVV